MDLNAVVRCEEDSPPSDQLNLRQPPPYPGLTKTWQQPGYCLSFSSSETGFEAVSSTENLSFSARQEPQGEETSCVLQSFGDGNPPPGGGVDGSLSSSKTSLDLAAIGDVGSVSLCATSGMVSSALLEPKVIVQDTIDQSSGYILSQSPVGQPPSYTLLRSSGSPSSSATTSPGGQSSGNVVSASGSPLLMYPSNSLIGQLLQCSSENSHLRNLLQNRYPRNCAAEPPKSKSSSKSCEESCESQRLPNDSSSEAETVYSQPMLVAATSSSEVSSGSHDDGAKAMTGSPKSRNGSHVAKATANGSPKGGAESRSVRNSLNTMQAISSGGVVVAHSKSGAPVRDLQRPSTAPSVHQMTAAVSDARFAVNGFLESANVPAAKTCVGSQPDLTCVVEVTMSNGATQQVPAKVVTSIRGRELMRLSSYSTVQQPPQYLLPMPKQVQHSNGIERQAVKLHAQSVQKKHLPDLDHAAIATRATEMVERLSDENQALRQELRSYYKKVSTLEKVEREIRKVSDAYEVLVLHSQKRENLEKLMRFKLETELRNLNEVNKQLKEQLERNMYQLHQKQGRCTPDSDLRRELRKQDALIAKLIIKNRELEMETSVQRSTMENQMKQIGMLENVLTDQQMHTGRCEEELEGHRAEDRSSSDLQMTLSDFQMMAEKREGAEQRFGTKIDEDFHGLRSQQCDTDDGISSDSESPTSIHSLIRQMQEKERRILQLEAEVAKWEQKFVDEAIFRQLAVEAISTPKDGRAISSEPNLVEDARCRTRMRSERALQLKEVYDANLRCAETETRLARAFILIRNLQTELAEKELLIKILQRHASLSRSSSISSLLLPSASSPMHSPHHRSPTNTAYMMSVPASGATSRQSSQVDDDQMYICTSREPDQQPMHVKSNSATGFLGNGYDAASVHSLELQYQASPQVLSYGSSQSLQSGCDQVKHSFWQV